jgi:hypothetical protein
MLRELHFAEEQGDGVEIVGRQARGKLGDPGPSSQNGGQQGAQVWNPDPFPSAVSLCLPAGLPLPVCALPLPANLPVRFMYNTFDVMAPAC